MNPPPNPDPAPEARVAAYSFVVDAPGKTDGTTIVAVSAERAIQLERELDEVIAQLAKAKEEAKYYHSELLICIPKVQAAALQTISLDAWRAMATRMRDILGMQDYKKNGPTHRALQDFDKLPQ